MKPSEEYTIKILSPEDYDMLPYAMAKQSQGMSILATKTAYIKSTGVRDLDTMTIEHEFDELMQQHSPHEIDGIRYKPILAALFQLFALAAGSAATEAVVTGAISKASGGSFKEGAKKGAISGAVGGATAGTLGPVAGSLTAPISSAAASVASSAATKPKALQGFTQGPPFAPSGATSAFAPQTANPLTREQFDTSLANLSKNALQKEEAVKKSFRGLGSQQENTAFSGAFKNAQTSSNLARSQFLEDQTKLGSTFV